MTSTTKKSSKVKKGNLRRSLVKKPAEQEQRIAELRQQLAESLRQKSATVSENVRLSKELQDRKVISLDPSVCVCTTMFRITPVHLLWALENLGAGKIVNQISVDERTRHFARAALDRMLSLR